jgi:hypothetical protein
VKTMLSIAAGAPVLLFGLSWGAMSMSPPDYATARWLMIGAAITAVVWYGFWLPMTDEPLWTRSLIGVGVGIVALGGLPWGLNWIEKRENSGTISTKSPPAPRPPMGTPANAEVNSSAPEPNPTLLQAQIAAFEKVQQFFGGLDESGLRYLFDFPNMLRFNILFIRRDLQKNNFPAELSTEMNNYFNGGQGTISLRYANVRATPSKVMHVEWIHGKIGVINTSRKFIESRQILADLLASTVLPSQVQESLREFDKTIQENIELMFDVLNERFSHNPAEFIFAEDPKSEYYGTIVGEYATRFHQFGPRADDIRQSIRKYLGTK